MDTIGRIVASALLLAGSIGLQACPDDGGSATDTTIQDTAGPDVTGDGDGDSTTKPDTPKPDIGGNSPPELERIGDRVVAVGETLVIVVEASDPDGDDLTYSVYGDLPEGARFIKPERRFEWSPEAVGEAVFLTFVVSDGQAFDRETVRIEVVADKGAHPPQFQVTGDQKVEVGVAMQLKLKATDPDGDTLMYGFEGKLPKNATLDAATGLFQWTPEASAAGATVRVTFTVSDGALTDTMEVGFVVVDPGQSGGPPVFTPLAAQTATVGVTLSFTLIAIDPDDDPVTYAIHQGAPEGATLTGATFSFKPASADAGKAYAVTFSATDGTYTAYQTVDIAVQKATPTTTCSNDPGEPNESIVASTALTPGTYERSICDTALVPIDTDFYSVVVGPGSTLTVEVTSDPSEGDLDLFLADVAGNLLASSETLSAVEAVSWKATAQKTVYPIVAGVGQESFAMPYTLTVDIAEKIGCTDDAFEDNDSAETAKPLPDSGTSLQVCPGDKDWWSVDLACGQQVTMTLDTGGSGDLDIELWPPGVTSGAPIASSATASDVEVATLASVPSDGSYRIKVVGWPSSTGEGSYTLDVAATGGCVEDASGGADAGEAYVLDGQTDLVSDLTICCHPDWFTIELDEGDQIIVDLTPTGPGAVGLALYGADAKTQLIAKAPAPSGAITQITAATTGTYYIRANGSTGTAYQLEYLVEPGTVGQCDTMSCPLYQVCDPDLGECVSDFCSVDADCPTGHICRETFCVNPCETTSDCRPDYFCKAFDAGLHCGVLGTAPPGAPCFSHTSCAGNAVCVYKGFPNDGYCAALGCLENEAVVCPSGTECTIDASDTSLCGKSCATDADCRIEDDFVCTAPEDTCLPQK